MAVLNGCGVALDGREGWYMHHRNMFLMPKQKQRFGVLIEMIVPKLISFVQPGLEFNLLVIVAFRAHRRGAHS